MASHPEYAAEINRLEEEAKRLDEEYMRLKEARKGRKKANKQHRRMLYWTLLHKDDADVRKLLEGYPLLSEQLQHSSYNLSEEEVRKAEKWQAKHTDCMWDELASFYQRVDNAFVAIGPLDLEKMGQLDWVRFMLLCFKVP